MGEQENNKGKNTYRWFIPLLVTIPFVIWESVAFGFELVKCGMSYMFLFVTYNLLISWIKCPADKKPSTTMLIICIPFLIALMLVCLPPFPLCTSMVCYDYYIHFGL